MKIAQGNPTSYLGHTLTWEKGRRLKSYDSDTNSNFIALLELIISINIKFGYSVNRKYWLG